MQYVDNPGSEERSLAVVLSQVDDLMSTDVLFNKPDLAIGLHKTLQREFADNVRASTI